MSHYWAAVTMAPTLMRQLTARAVRHTTLAIAAVTALAILHLMGATTSSWPAALIALALTVAAPWLLWDAWDCLRIRRDLRRKLEA